MTFDDALHAINDPFDDGGADPERPEEVVYWAYVQTGILEVRGDGTVWRVKDWNPILVRVDGGKLTTVGGSWIPCDPRRADTKESRRMKPNRYKRVQVRHQGRVMSCMAHRLVYRALIGPIPAGLEVNHKDRCRWNNHPENLECLTPLENTEYAYVENGGSLGRGDDGRFMCVEAPG